MQVFNPTTFLIYWLINPKVNFFTITKFLKSLQMNKLPIYSNSIIYFKKIWLKKSPIRKIRKKLAMRTVHFTHSNLYSSNNSKVLAVKNLTLTLENNYNPSSVVKKTLITPKPTDVIIEKNSPVRVFQTLLNALLYLEKYFSTTTYLTVTSFQTLLRVSTLIKNTPSVIKTSQTLVLSNFNRLFSINKLL